MTEPGAARGIALDAGPLSELCRPDATHPDVREIRAWVGEHLAAGAAIFIPEIADYEVRRQLLLNRRARSLRRLDELAQELIYLPLTTAIIRRAAEFWAAARQQGQPGAPPEAIDADVILAAQAESVGAVVATDNVRHFEAFVSARPWREIR